MKQYDSYKDSGVQWIGMIPSHWEIVRLKHYCDIYGRIGFRGYTNEDLVSEEDGAITLSPTNIVDGKMNYDKCSYLSWDKYYESPEIMVSNGDMIFVKTASVGKNALVENLPKEATLNPQFVVFKNIKCNKKYLYWQFQTPNIQYQVDDSKVGSTIPTISQEKIGNYTLLMPSHNEQQTIASYLDKKCAEIDKAIATQQKRIELLQELRQNIITHAVTRGINPDVPLKDSGVEWIGKIPEHWSIKRMRFLCRINTGDKDTINKEDDGLYPFYVRSPQVERINTYSYDGEAVLMAGDGVGAGKVVHYANGKFDYHQRVYCFYDYKEVKTLFAFYYLSSNFRYKIEEGGAKNTVDSVRLPWLKDFPICIPSLEEQDEILIYIAKETAKLDKLMSKANRQISLLQELKQSLITEVVTGKRKVC